MSKHRCSKRVPSETGYGPWPQCSRKATVERDGQAFCTQHDPERVSAQRAERLARWDKEWAEQRRESRREELAHELAALAVKEPDTFPPNAQPIVQQLIALSPPPAGQSR